MNLFLQQTGVWSFATRLSRLVTVFGVISLLPLPALAQQQQKVQQGSGPTIIIYNGTSSERERESTTTTDEYGNVVEKEPTYHKPTDPNDLGYFVNTSQVSDVPPGLQQVSTSNQFTRGSIKGQAIYQDGASGKYYVSQGSGCKLGIAASCYSMDIVNSKGESVLAKEGLDASIANANASKNGFINRPAGTNAGGNCSVNVGKSQGGETVEDCDNGTQKVTYANGAVEVRKIGPDGLPLTDDTGKTMGVLSNFNAADSQDDGYSWKNAAAYQGQKDGDPCKTGKTIDGKRFGCATSDAMVKGGQLLMQGSDMVGSARITQQGMATYQQVQMSGGAPDVVYDGTGDMYENAGKTQKTVGTLNLISGMSQMLASTKALKAKADLEKEKKELTTKLQTTRHNGQELAEDGTGKGQDGYIGVNPDKVTYKNKRKGTAEDIADRVITNFDLNSSSKLTTFNEKRDGMDIKSAKNNATVMREKELALKERKVRGDATEILQKAIQEQTEAAGRALQGGMQSAVGGMVQRMNGNQAIQTGKQFHALADSMKAQVAGAPGLDLTNQNDNSAVTARTGSAITGSPEGPTTSTDNAATTATAPAGPLGGPLNTQMPVNNPGPGYYGGGFAQHDPLSGGGGGGAGGGGGGPNAQLGGLNQAPLPGQAALLAPPPGPDKHTEFKELRGYESTGGAVAAAGGGGGENPLGDLVKSLLREDGNGKKIEDGHDLSFGGGRNPASADMGGPIHDSSTDLFKQISSAYRGKSEQGAVGFSSGRQ